MLQTDSSHANSFRTIISEVTDGRVTENYDATYVPRIYDTVTDGRSDAWKLRIVARSTNERTNGPSYTNKNYLYQPYMKGTQKSFQGIGMKNHSYKNPQKYMFIFYTVVQSTLHTNSTYPVHFNPRELERIYITLAK